MQLLIVTSVINHFTQCRTPNSLTCIRWKNAYDLLDKTHLQISERFQLCNQVLGIHGKHRAINSKPTSRCIHPSTHNQSFSETVYLGPSKSIHYNKLWQYSRTTSPVLGDVGVILPLAVQGRFSMSAVLSIQYCRDMLVTMIPRSSTPR